MQNLISKKLINLIPFGLICLILIYTWYIILSTDIIATWRHWLALSLALVNLVVYYFRFLFGLIFTGAFLLLACFSLLSIFPERICTSYFLKLGETEISTPGIDGKSFWLFLLYLALNTGYFIKLYLHHKYPPKEQDEQ